jgi:hypothetical protein
MRNELTGREEVEVAHEALIRHWDQLRDWLARDRADLRLRQELGQAARTWERGGRDESHLVHWGSRLEETVPLPAKFGLNEGERAYLDACIAREAARERSRYLGQAAGGAVGAGLGYATAFGINYWSMTPSVTPTLLLLVVFASFPFGALVGICIGIGLWLLRRHPAGRAVSAVVIGAIAGMAAYWLFLEFFILRPSDSTPLGQLAAGGLLGCGIGLGVGFSQGRSALVGLVGTVLTCLLGAILFRFVGNVPWSPIDTLLAGLLLGSLTGLGFQATAVRPNTQPARSAVA